MEGKLRPRGSNTTEAHLPPKPDSLTPHHSQHSVLHHHALGFGGAEGAQLGTQGGSHIHTGMNGRACHARQCAVCPSMCEGVCLCVSACVNMCVYPVLMQVCIVCAGSIVCTRILWAIHSSGVVLCKQWRSQMPAPGPPGLAGPACPLISPCQGVLCHLGARGSMAGSAPCKGRPVP